MDNNPARQEYLFDGAVFEKINPLLEKLIGFLFRKVSFEGASLKTLQDHANSKVIYASFHTSNLSLLIFYTLLKRHDFKIPAAALDYNPFMFQPAKYLFRRLIRNFERLFAGGADKDQIDTSFIEGLLKSGSSVLVSLLSPKHFLKRYMEVKYDSLMHLVDIQKRTEEPIYVMPQLIFWNMNPERTDSIISSSATGHRGIISGWFTVIRSITPSFVRISTPINLKEEIAASPTDDSRHIAVTLRNRLLEIYHHEKRSVLGPVIKSQQVMAERVLNHRNVLDEIRRVAAEQGRSESRLKKRAFKQYREIAANFSITMIRFFEIALDIIFRKIFDGISYDPAELAMVREAMQKGPLVLTPCHKSHMDYLIVSYIFYKNKLIPPHIAAGVNLSFFPMGFIFRHSGAFFMRRSFKGLSLYPEVFKQYIKTMVNEGYPIEFFIEGGRTRTGKLAYPKYGFLNFLLDAVDEGYNKDLVFVPISINYDRILEETSYVKEMKGREKEAESAKGMLESTRLLRRKYGKVYVKFNKPFTLKEVEALGVSKDERSVFVSEHIVKKINEVTMVTPFALTSATILLHAIKGFSRQTLLEKMRILYGFLAYVNVDMSDSLQRKINLEEIIETVLTAFLDDKIIEPLKDPGSGGMMEDFYVINEDQRPRIVFYKNSIIHYLIPISFFSLALLYLHGKNELTGGSLDAEYEQIKRVFSREFIYATCEEGAGEDREQVMLEYLKTQSIVELDGDAIRLSEGSIEVLKFFARIARDYLESYLVALQSLGSWRKDRSSKKEIVQDVRKTGIRLFHTGDVRLMESLSLPNYNNALKMLMSEGALREVATGKKSPDLEIVDREKLKDILEKVNSYLYALG
ncbi:MAG: 1-acyl-sn-glycerol-3-phosphate acyltransferase [Spirochaetes bacterium]|nr:1-acyl-sn-glycerol-3-phosphate acyltransferase [Spirochaetota bacterium]